MVKNGEKKVLEMLALIDADRLACAYGILDLNAQNKKN